ncbi:MAG: hypothetical protein QOK39_199, partial [Acidimicrobiaceae bacterium]|nr:hypothetical protein [Acidimicrobiaceae bacterium]
HREAPEIDGVVQLPVAETRERVGQFVTVHVTASAGPDLEATLAPAEVAVA